MDPINRRVFVKSGAMALLAMGLPPAFVTRSLLADTRAAARKKTLICIFQRGAVDGLSMVVPFGEAAYYRGRRSIAIADPSRRSDRGALDLDGFFGMHPSLKPLHELYGRKELAIVHAAGSPSATRSHFEAQDVMETASPDGHARDGWLNRVLGATDCHDCSGRTLADARAHAADHAAGQTGVASLRGVAMGATLPLSLRGAEPTLAIADLERFGVAGGRDDALSETFARMYRTGTGDAVSAAAGEGMEAAAVLRKVDPARYASRPGVEYPAGDFGRSLRQIAQLVKAEVGVEVAFADLSGWDTHVAQGGADGQLARRLDELARGIRALHDDLGERMEDVVILTMSEFGRTVAENGTGGTDHGHANCMMVLGGSVAGGKVYGDWPGLEPAQLYEGRDLKVTTDFRDVFAEVTARHLGATHLDRVFPGYSLDPSKYRRVLR
ncbi:MAG TPA: DUF1501 domain-containing protein [Longimicrobiaceae bacterium]|jgi:uncharacterized protein (DUF1501 family)|nr:DUF1501 domain-containing protein [Longimicrobiaceae bacterium]